MRLPVIALALAACGSAVAAQQTALAPENSPMDWILAIIDGQPAAASATLNLERPGWITGQAPCNGYSARLDAEGAGFLPGPILSTKRACDDLRAENAYFEALQGVESAEEVSGTLTLTGPDHVLVFSRPVE